jgi:hypothetical protein
MGTFADLSPMRLVPDAVLVPPEAHGRGFSQHETALVLDGYLRRLASQNSRCRTVLGRLAKRFLARSLYHELGFARLADYARERLAISARELESLAAATAALERLPDVRDAFERGELSWSQLRLLIGVATPDTQATWLDLARGRTVRALAALVRDRSATAEDYEPHARFRLRCSRRVLRLWRDTVELARRMAGSELTQGQAAEAIAAEGLAARPSCAEAWPATPSAARAADPDETRTKFADIDWTAVAEAIPDDVTRLADGVEELDARGLDDRMRVVLRAMHRIDWQLGRLLRVFLDRRLYRLMWFPSAGRYLTERLEMSARRARALVALERKTWQAPALREAYETGTVSSLQAIVMLPVIGDRTAPAWIARAGQVTLRRLSDEVEWALTVRDGVTDIGPPSPRASLAIPARQMCARPEWEFPDAEIAFTAPVSVVALFRTAVLAFAHPRDSLPGGLEALLRQPRHRDPVFARDGWRCAVPICTARRNLHDHHVVFRSRGGDNGRDNRITLCAWHHLRGIHAGRVRASGEAPDGIRWEIGVHAGRRPLFRLDAAGYIQ